MKKILMLMIGAAVGTYSAQSFAQAASTTATAAAGVPTQVNGQTQQSIGSPQSRTYVSGSGSDSNPCSATAPCLTFQAALTATAAGGEIFVLDSADYGPVTINKAVSITSEGASAGVLATSGTAITITAGANDTVNIRGLNIDGRNTAATGIAFTSGASLNIQKSTIRGFLGSGINFAPTATSTLLISDTVVTNNQGSGILISADQASAAKGMLGRITASGNGVGIFANGKGVSVTLTDSLSGNNGYGLGAFNSSVVMVRNSSFNNNKVGIAADQMAMVRIGHCTITANTSGLNTSGGGTVFSFGNNDVGGNTADGVVSSTLALR